MVMSIMVIDITNEFYIHKSSFNDMYGERSSRIPLVFFVTWRLKIFVISFVKIEVLYEMQWW